MKNHLKNIYSILLYKLLFWAALSLIALSTYSCSEPASPFGQTDITLSALDASCTEVWLELKFSNLSQPADVAIQKDGKDYLRLLSLNRDTLLVFEDLEPSTNYSFCAIIRHEGKDDKISNTAEVRTMDTTNHSFTWEVFEFGEGLASSAFYDIAYISENDIWVVGEIYFNDTYTYDTLGNYIQPYNAVHWDGLKWERKQMFYKTTAGPSFRPIHSLYAINKDEIWFGNFVQFKNGAINSLNLNISFPALVNGIWAASSTEVYIVGGGGRIAKHSGYSWEIIPSGTEFDLHDINSNSEGRVLIAGGFYLRNIGGIILKKNGTVFEKVLTFPESKEVMSIAPIGKFKTLTVGAGIFQSNDNLANWKELLISNSYSSVVRANSHNQIAIAGHFSSFLYFNGVRWQDKSEIGFPEIPRTIWKSIAINTNEVILIGMATENNKAIILRGKIG
ncbi:MAG: hypothetical protein HRU80_03935 [Ignavibacteriales bacterium]|nr:hypothetical protein [Ignavibacteriaceae bacterium]QOJ28067.1 MAG: hypothetical protein HRU80_03935 [Ignavibacteriales bacterium]